MAVLRCLHRVKPTSICRRSLTTGRSLRLPYKDSQDRNSIRTGSTENTKTGRDNEMAEKHPKAAFDPSKTSPEEAYRTASVEGSGKKTTSNPLEASGANQELSKPLGDEKTSRGNGPGKETSRSSNKASGWKSPPKKGDPYHP